MIGYGDKTLVMQEAAWQALCDQWIRENRPGKRILILPPDRTRLYSCAGEITAYLYRKLCAEHEITIMPALGTHMQMNPAELASFFPGVPQEVICVHNWKEDTVKLGTVPASYVSLVTDGKCPWDIDVLINHKLVDGSFDTIISVGQVVPHEVVGMANYTKNLVVGVGGKDMINKSHMVSAYCNIETIMGNIDSPVRAIFDYAQKEFLDSLNIHFFLTVTTEKDAKAYLHGLFIGKERGTFEAAAKLAQQTNITWLSERVSRMVCWLEPDEFRSTWVGNKAIYRTRMAIADGGELVIIAPGLKQFGENLEVDAVIRQFGYKGTAQTLQLYAAGAFEGYEAVAAHLIHGSSDGRFRIIYATDESLMARQEIEAAGFEWMPVKEAMNRYKPLEKNTGFFEDREGTYYFVKAPAVGLWRK